MALHDYTGTPISTKETIYPSSAVRYYLQDAPYSISAVIAYAITDIHNYKDGADIQIEDEYALSIATSVDTFIEVTQAGKISDSSLKIKHKEGVTGTWSSEYTPTNPQVISGVSYSFSSDDYALGANWEFKIWKLEPVVYSPTVDTQLYINLANGRCLTNADDLYDRIALRFDSIGSVIRTDTLNRLAGERVFLYQTSAPSSIVYVSSGVIVLSGYIDYVGDTTVDVRKHISFNGEASKHAYLGLYYYDSGGHTTTLGTVEGEVEDSTDDIYTPLFPAECFPIGVVEVETDSSGSVTAITNDKLYSEGSSGNSNLPKASTQLKLTNYYSDTLAANKFVYLCAENKIALANPENSTNARVIGVTAQAIPGNQSGTVVRLGIVGGWSGLIIGTSYYLAANGAITDEYPTSGTVVDVGTVIDSTTMYVNPSIVGVLSDITYLLFMGGIGLTGSNFNTNKKFTPTSNSWDSMTNVPIGRDSGIVLWVANSALLINGNESYDTLSNATKEFHNDAWTTRTNALQEKKWVAGSAIQAKAYVWGGYTSTGATRASHVYSNNTWTSIANMLSPAVYSMGGTTLNNKGYICYGYTGSANLLATEEYTPTTDTWASKATPPSPGRYELVLSALDNKGYAYGGYYNGALNYNLEYSPTNVWTTKTHKATATYAHTGGTASDGLYTSSGQTNATTLTDEHERYTVDTWIARTASEEARYAQETGFFG